MCVSPVLFSAVLSWGSLPETAPVVETPRILRGGDLQQLALDGRTQYCGYYWGMGGDEQCLAVLAGDH